MDPSVPVDAHSHGRGRWFEPSIAHSKKMEFCRKDVRIDEDSRYTLGPLCSNAAPSSS